MKKDCDLPYDDIKVFIDSITFSVNFDFFTLERLASLKKDIYEHSMKLFKIVSVENVDRSHFDNSVKMFFDYCLPNTNVTLPPGLELINVYAERTTQGHTMIPVIYFNFKRGEFIYVFQVHIRYDNIFLAVNLSLNKFGEGCISSFKKEYNMIEEYSILKEYAYSFFIFYLIGISGRDIPTERITFYLNRIDLIKDIIVESDEDIFYILGKLSKRNLPMYEKAKFNEGRNVLFIPAHKSTRKVRMSKDSQRYITRHGKPRLNMYHKSKEIERFLLTHPKSKENATKLYVFRYEQQFYKSQIVEIEPLQKLKSYMYKNHGDFPNDIEKIISNVFNYYDPFKGKLKVTRDKHTLRRMFHKEKNTLDVVLSIMNNHGSLSKAQIINKTGLSKNTVTRIIQGLRKTGVLDIHRNRYYYIKEDKYNELRRLIG